MPLLISWSPFHQSRAYHQWRSEDDAFYLTISSCSRQAQRPNCHWPACLGLAKIVPRWASEQQCELCSPLPGCKTMQIIRLFQFCKSKSGRLLDNTRLVELSFLHSSSTGYNEPAETTPLPFKAKQDYALNCLSAVPLSIYCIIKLELSKQKACKSYKKLWSFFIHIKFS